MNNIISAIINLVETPKIELIHKGSSHNRANNMGEALEEYIKDLFAGTVDKDPNNPAKLKEAKLITFSIGA